MISLQRWVQHFPRGESNFFGGGGGGGGEGGVQMLISIENHITCDFPGGGGPDPLSPLWVRTRDRLTPLLWSIKI